MRTDLTSKERELRNAFPLLKNSTLAYLDNGATSQKPQAVIDAVAKYYEHDNANPMRGLYDLSYEEARAKVAKFIHAPKAEEIVFTRNASESLNLIAYSYGMHFLKEGDEILVGITEHHSNFLPWQQVGKVTKAKVNLMTEKSALMPFVLHSHQIQSLLPSLKFPMFWAEKIRSRNLQRLPMSRELSLWLMAHKAFHICQSMSLTLTLTFLSSLDIRCLLQWALVYSMERWNFLTRCHHFSMAEK